MANRVQIFMAPLASSTGLVKEGKLRALGFSSPARLPLNPEIPTIAEAGFPGFRWDSWGALFAPASGADALTKVFPAVQANAWLLFDGGKAKVSPDTVGIPKP